MKQFLKLTISIFFFSITINSNVQLTIEEPNQKSEWTIN